MKRYITIPKFLLIFVIIAAWIFSGFPPIWQNPKIPSGIQEAQAVTFPATSYLSSTASTRITTTVSWQIVTTAPGASDVTTSCKYAKTTGYCQEQPGVANTANAQPKPTSPNGKGWIYDLPLNSTIPTGTWTFNIRTTNSYISTNGAATYMSVCAWKVAVTTGTIASSTNIINCVDGTTNLQNNATALFVSSVSVASVPAVSFAGNNPLTNEYLYVEYWLHSTVAGTGATAKVTFEANAGASDDIVLPGASTNLAPNAPSQDSPANSATGVSVTPTFLMTATDPELNYLGYKVTIYSNSACTTVVQTNDQAVSSAGWTLTNATCTAAPTSCYTSGTQGSFLTQTALTAGTQYWWKASAKDPDGNGSFTNSSTCNNFTTAANVSIIIDTNANVPYGVIALAGTKSTTPSELNNTQVVRNNGSVTETFQIIGKNSAAWSLVTGTPTGEQYKHEFSASGGVPYAWTALTSTGYTTMATGITSTGNTTRPLDLRITLSDNTTTFTSQDVGVTVQAIQ